MQAVILFMSLVVACVTLFYVFRIHGLIKEMQAFDERDFEIERAVPVNSRVAYEVPQEVEVNPQEVIASGMPKGGTVAGVSDSDMEKIISMVIQAQGGK